MDPDVAIQLAAVIILLGLSAFFSSAETALVTVNKIKMKTLADAGNKKAKTVLKITEDQAKMLSVILIGNNIVNISASALMTVFVTNLFGAMWVGAATGVMTLLVLIFGEITPKTLATFKAENLALAYGGIINFLMVLLTPAVWIVNFLSSGVLALLGVDRNQKPDTITEEELRTLVDMSHEEGVIETEEKKMITNVFDFGDRRAKDIMIPRIDVVFADVDSTYEELLEIFRRDKFTRLPVYEETKDNVIGIINMKDLLLIGEKKDFSIRDILREPLYTYEFKKVSELMVDMRKTFHNLVIVLDEYGATAGMITLEDMIEEIVGEIRDEYDAEEEEAVKKIEDNLYEVDGSERIDDIDEWLSLDLHSDDYDSIGGLVIGLLDHLPKEGESVDYEGIHFEVVKVEKNRIERIRMYLPKKEKCDIVNEQNKGGTDHEED